MMIFFEWLGVFVTALALLVALAAACTWAVGFCMAVAHDVHKRYKYSRLHEKLVNKTGYEYAHWLMNYDLTHGMFRGKFTAKDWMNLFAERLGQESKGKEE